MRILMGGLCAVVLAAVLPLPRPTIAAAGPCERLSSLALPSTTITLAQTVAAGGFVLPARGGPGAAQGAADLPAFCRVAAVVKPSSDSHIEMEVWLPIENWN